MQFIHFLLHIFVVYSLASIIIDLLLLLPLISLFDYHWSFECGWLGTLAWWNFSVSGGWKEIICDI